jgi:hypothetical protein
VPEHRGGISVIRLIKREPSDIRAHKGSSLRLETSRAWRARERELEHIRTIEARRVCVSSLKDLEEGEV